MAAKKRTSRKPVTLGEFRAWLEGVEELQENDWHPTTDQWVTIRKKINAIVAEEAPIQHARPAPQPAGHPGPAAHNQMPAPGPSAQVAPALQPASFVSTEHNAAVTPPNLDTSDGNYDSTFE